MSIIQTPKRYAFLLDTTLPNITIPRMTFTQSDKGSNILTISLTEILMPYPLTATGVVVNLFVVNGASKSWQSSTDGSITIVDATNGIIQIVLASDTISNVGVNNCQINILDSNGNDITFPKFNFTVVDNYANNVASENSLVPLLQATSDVINYTKTEDYDNTHPYVKLNKVTYQGGTYQNIVPCTGISPSFNIDNANWLCISKKGLDGFSSIIPSSFVATVNNTTHIITGYTNFDPINDTLEVFDVTYDSELIEGIDYTKNADNLSIDLINDNTINIGEIIKFKLFKNVVSIGMQAQIDNAVTAATNLNTSSNTASIIKTTLDASITSGDINTRFNIVNLQLTDIMVNIKTLGAKGDGITDDTAIFTSATNIKNLLIPEGMYKITSNVTLNGCVTMNNGAILNIATGATVTLNGTFKAGVCQIFSGLGTVIFNQSFNKIGFPEWWGAIANNITIDCLSAINSCIVTLPITQLQKGNYYISNTINITMSGKTLQGLGYRNATKIIITSSTLDIIFVGTTSKPIDVNNYVTNTNIKDIELERSLLPFSMITGEEKNGCKGIKLQYTLFTYIEKIRTNENIIGFYIGGTVATHITECFSFRSLQGTSSVNDTFYGYYLDGNIDIGMAGGNASTYITDSSASIGGYIEFTNSIGFYLDSKPADSFLLRPDVSNCRTGILINGDDSQAGNEDIHIINPIIDSFKDSGILIQNLGKYGAIEVMGGYVASANTGIVSFGYRVESSIGLISFVNCQAICWTNAFSIGLWIQNSTSVSSKNNIYLGSSRPICLISSLFCIIEDSINNPQQVATQGAVFLSNSLRNYIKCLIKGIPNAFPKGVELNGANNNYNEINCTPIDSSAITGGSTNKVVINGVQVTTIGLSGTNLVGGIMV